MPKPTKIGDVINGRPGVDKPAPSLASQVQALKAAKEAAPALSPAAHTYVMGLTFWDGQPGDPNCPDCHGSGGFRVDLPAHHPRYGKLFACSCRATAMQSEHTKRLQDVSALFTADLALTWDSIAPTPFILPAITATKEMLARGWGWVYAYGPNGPGKTRLLKVAVAESIRAGRPAVFVVYADLLNHLRAGFKDDTYDARLEAWRAADILAVDEYGRANDTKWAAEAQVLIFNHRHERSTAGHKGITLFSSNTAPGDLEGWIADRIQDGRNAIVNVDGPSMRPMMKDGNQ